jgi:plasmid stabilization system protein ParE
VNAYLLGTAAVLDLEDIWDYIASDNIDAADRWIAKLLDAFDDIARMPGIGHRREDLTDLPVLFWTVGAYLIIYRAKPGQRVEIVAVTQGSRDIPSFLRRRLH